MSQNGVRSQCGRYVFESPGRARYNSNMQTRKRKITLTVIGVVALSVTVIALKRPLSEQWCLWKLESDDPATRDLAARSLGEMRSIRAIPPLIELLRQIPPEPTVKVYFTKVRGRWAEGGWEAAQLALTKIAAPALPSLVELLGESDSTVRLRAIDALGMIGPKAKPTVPALIRAALTALFADQEEQVVTRATHALAKIQQQ